MIGKLQQYIKLMAKIAANIVMMKESKYKLISTNLKASINYTLFIRISHFSLSLNIHNFFVFEFWTIPKLFLNITGVTTAGNQMITLL